MNNVVKGTKNVGKAALYTTGAVAGVAIAPTLLVGKVGVELGKVAGKSIGKGLTKGVYGLYNITSEGISYIRSSKKLSEKIKIAKKTERDLEVGDIVDVYDYFFDIQTDNEIINNLYAKYVPKITDMVEFKKGIVVEEKEDKKETKKKDEKEEEASSADDEDEDSSNKDDKEKEDKTEKKVLVGRIISIYNSEKSKDAPEDKQCDPSPGKDKCLFKIRDMLSNKLYSGIFAANIQPTLEYILLSPEYLEIKEKQEKATDEKKMEERIKKLKQFEELNTGTFNDIKNVGQILGSAVGKGTASTSQGLTILPAELSLVKSGLEFGKEFGKNIFKKKSLEKSINEAAYHVAKDTAKDASVKVVSQIHKNITTEDKKQLLDKTLQISDDIEKNKEENKKIINNQLGGSKKEFIAKQMLKIHKMNSKTKKGIIIEKNDKAIDKKKKNILGPYSVFVFENIDQDLLRLGSIEETDINKSMEKFMTMKAGGIEELKKHCVLTNLPAKAFKQKKQQIYQKRKEGDIIDVFFQKNDKVWKTIEKEIKSVNKEFDKDTKNNSYETLLEKLKEQKSHKFCNGRIGKIEKKEIKLEIGVLRNIVKELDVKLLEDENGAPLKDLTGIELKENIAIIAASSRSIPLNQPTKSLYTFISDPDNNSIKADYKTPKDHITNYRKEGDNHWLEHTININDDGTFFAVLKEKEEPIIVSRNDKYNVESKDLEYRNYYGTRKTAKAIGFKKLYHPNEIAENIKKYHPLTGNFEDIKEMFTDEIENKHEFLKFEKEIEKEEEERRKKEEENAAVDSAENEMEGQKNEIDGQKNKIKELKQQITEKCGEKMKKDDEEACEKWKKEKKKEEKIQDTMGFKLTSLKNQLFSLNKCGRRPKSWSDYQKKMGCDIKSISDSISNMILKLIKPASQIIMKNFATLPGYEDEWQQIYPIYVKAKKKKIKQHQKKKC